MRKDIMLCQPLDDRNLERNWKLSKVLLVQPKLDGVRAWTDGANHLISSEGNVLQGTAHLVAILSTVFQQVAQDILGKHITLDGEVYRHKGLSFEEISGLARARFQEKSWELQYHVFDYKSTEVQAQRLENLEKVFTELYKRYPEYEEAILLVPTQAVTSFEAMSKCLDEYLAQGYEGIVVRNPLVAYDDRPGKASRPYTMLKWKPSKQDQYIIHEVIEAVSADGQPLNRVGAFTCRDELGNTFRVGGGLGMNLHKLTQLWEMRDALIGKTATVCYQNLTSNHLPRFGKCISIEED